MNVFSLVFFKVSVHILGASSGGGTFLEFVHPCSGYCDEAYFWTCSRQPGVEVAFFGGRFISAFCLAADKLQCYTLCNTTSQCRLGLDISHFFRARGRVRKIDSPNRESSG